MKRICSFFSIFILLSLAFIPQALAIAPTPSIPAASVEYSLPYPGLLPDNPFYVLKVVRDQLILWLVRDPNEKAFYQLLLSDKRLTAGEILINTGKIPLGVTTIVIGENFYRQAVNSTLRSGSSNSVDLVAKLTLAGAKHLSVIASLFPKVSGRPLSELETAYQESQLSQSRVMEVLVTPRR